MHFHTQLNIFLHKKKKKKRNRFHNFIKNHKKVLKILSLDSISHPKKYNKRTYIYKEKKKERVQLSEEYKLGHKGKNQISQWKSWKILKILLLDSISHPEKSITTKHIYMYIKREKKRVVIWKNISWPKKRGADKIAGPWRKAIRGTGESFFTFYYNIYSDVERAGNVCPPLGSVKIVPGSSAGKARHLHFHHPLRAPSPVYVLLMNIDRYDPRLGMLWR